MDLTTITEVNCTQAAIDDFPTDLFTQEQRQNGAVVLHVIASLYLFAALAVVCDKYFVPAVDKMCKVLNMSNDVAGATFMAAATSAPELFVNVIGTFITEGDIGVGTIVGSAVFNILAVAACCGIGAGMVVPLDWWPLTRDCVAYGTTVAILICIIHDERVEWYEALILVLLYLVYIAVMYFDKKIQKWARAFLEFTMVIPLGDEESPIPTSREIEAIEVRQSLQSKNKSAAHQQFNGTIKQTIIQSLQCRTNTSKVSANPSDATQDTTKDEINNQKPKNEKKAVDHTKIIVDKNTDDSDKIISTNKDLNIAQELEIKKDIKDDVHNEAVKIDENVENGEEKGDEYEHNLWEWPSGRGWFIQESKEMLFLDRDIRCIVFGGFRDLRMVIFNSSFRRTCYRHLLFTLLKMAAARSPKARVKNFHTEILKTTEHDFKDRENLKSYTRWIITWPIYLVFICSIPDCEKKRFKSWYPVTFLMCIIWIGSLSYVVAWMITILGHTLKIPDSVMGITFLAAGTSVPEAVSSVIVAKKGHGSMGISNSIGSNTFDILLCLGLPWLIKAAFIPTDPEHHWVAINSSGLEYSAISLLSTLFMLYIAFYFNKFRLDMRVGRACLCMYAVFLVLATLIELNVFFRVNLPTCGR